MELTSGLVHDPVDVYVVDIERPLVKQVTEYK